jgi:hypothetical protein
MGSGQMTRVIIIVLSMERAKDEIVILERGKNDPAIKAEVGFNSEHYSIPYPFLRG